MAGVELRPLSLGQVLDRTFSLYRNNFWLFVGIMAIPSCLSIPFSFISSTQRSSPFSVGRPVGPAPTAGFFLAFFVLALIAAAVYAVALGAATFAVSDVSLGKPMTVSTAYGKVRGHFWSLIGLLINIYLRMIGIFIVIGLAAVLVAGGMAAGGRLAGNAMAAIIIGFAAFLAFVAAFVLAIWFMLRYSVAFPAMLLEDIHVGESIQRSVDLTEGSRGRIFVAALLSVLIAYVGFVIFQGPFFIATMVLAAKGQTLGWVLPAMSISGAIGNAITSPILMIVIVLCYYDLRIRKEGFDLQYKMASLGQDPPQSVPPPSAPPLGVG
jgi:hypothetical protein